MICDLNDFVGFMGAIYFTITVDNLLFKRFWTPNLYSIVNQSFQKFNFALSTPLKNELMSVVRSNSNKIDSESRYRGCFLLSLCIYLLAYIALNPFSNTCEHLLALISTYTIAFIVYVIGIFTWKRWKWVSISIVLVPFIYMLCYFIIQQTILADKWQECYALHATGICTYVKIFIILSLILPVVIRLITNWLNSNIYVEYLTLNLTEEYRKYKQTEEGLITKDINKCAKEYDIAFKSGFFANNLSSSDQGTTEFKKVLVERLKEIIRTKNMWFLVRYVCSKDRRTTPYQQINSDKSVYVLPDSPSVNTNYIDYCEEYAKLDGVRISSFCKEKNINEESFKAFRKKWLKQQKS